MDRPKASTVLWTELSKERDNERCRMSFEFLNKLRAGSSCPSPTPASPSVKEDVIKELKDMLVKWNMDMCQIINAQNEKINHVIGEIESMKAILKTDIKPSITNLKDELNTVLNESISQLNLNDVSSTRNIQPTNSPSNLSSISAPPHSSVSENFTLFPRKPETSPFGSSFHFSSPSPGLCAKAVEDKKKSLPSETKFAPVVSQSSGLFSFTTPVSATIAPSMDKKTSPSIFGNIKYNSPSFMTQQPEKDTFKFNVPMFSGNTSNIEDDISIIYEQRPPESSMLAKLNKYQLPLNFFRYVDAKPCTGCRGCQSPSDPEEEAFLNELTADNEEPEPSKLEFKPFTFEFQPKTVFSPFKKDSDDEGGEEVEREPKIEFTPLVHLEPVETKTGEEDEEQIFVSRSKIYIYREASKEWKERGVGEFKILKHKSNNTYRMLLRRDKVLKVACNQRITSSLSLTPHPNMLSAVCWYGCDYSDAAEEMGNFCIRFKTPELKDEFVNEVEKIKLELASEPIEGKVPSQIFDTDQVSKAPTKTEIKNPPKSVPSKQESCNTPCVETIPSSPNEPLKKLVDESLSQAEPPLVFGSFLSASQTSDSNLFAQAIADSNIKPEWSTAKTSFDFKPKPVFHSSRKESDDEGGEEVESEPKIEFTPLVHLEPVETKTGEEDEEQIFVSRAKIYIYRDASKEWKERGVGEFKILKHTSNNTYRMLLRRDKVLKVACNQRITSSLSLTPHPNMLSAVCWYGCDYSDAAEEMGNFCIRFKTEELKNKFVAQVETIKKSFHKKEENDISKPGDSQAQDSSSKKSDSNISHPNKSETDAESNLSNVNKSSIPPSSNFPESSKTVPLKESTPVFGSFLPSPSTDPGLNLFGQAIADLNVSKTWPTSQAVSFDLTSKPLFSAAKSENDEETSEDVESEPKVEFTPLVHLEPVETKTGEEDEEPTFVSRAKIYIFDDSTKEWKERGVGEFKILKHKSNNTYRMLLRRDKVLKVACNQRITSSLSLTPHPNMLSAVCWYGCDYSDAAEKMGNFCIRFKTEDLTKNFITEIKKIKELLSEGSVS